MHHPLVTLVRAELADLPRGTSLFAAVSGGADSTALLHLLVAANRDLDLGLALGVVHLDHALRPDSTAAAAFVTALAHRLDLPCRLEQSDVAARARDRGLGLEEAGRAARHDFFARVAAGPRLGPGSEAVVALAHTRDDQAETLLLHLVRGCGTAGLAAMRATAFGHLRRPLLSAARADLRDFLGRLGEDWVEDPSNRDPRHTRNRIRHEVLPLLATINPEVTPALARTAAILAAEDDWLEAEALRHLPAPGTDSTRLPVAALRDLPDALARRAALAWLRRAASGGGELGHVHVDAVLDLARGRRAVHATDLPGGGRLVREGTELVLIGGRATAAAREGA